MFLHHLQPLLQTNTPTNQICMVSPESYLMTSIVLETTSTILLTKTINNKMWFAPVYIGYGFSFYLFPKALQKFQLSVAYTIWSGFGIIFTMVYDAIKLRKLCQMKQLMGSLLVILGIYLVNQ
jgi:small multidrug resistance pump